MAACDRRSRRSCVSLLKSTETQVSLMKYADEMSFPHDAVHASEAELPSCQGVAAFATAATAVSTSADRQSVPIACHPPQIPQTRFTPAVAASCETRPIANRTVSPCSVCRHRQDCYDESGCCHIK